MKKQIFVLAALAIFFAACKDKDNGPDLSIVMKTATFENAQGGVNIAKADTVWQGADNPTVGTHKWKSGSYYFVSITQEWGYSGFTASNETATTSTGMTQPYRNAKGRGHESANFAVWTDTYDTNADITFINSTVPGFYINNNAYAVNSMLYGDSYARKFTDQDWFLLTIHGLKGTTEVGTVEFYLAKDGKYVNDWTYVDLSSLGTINGIHFTMSSSDESQYGMNTPAYFCIDDFGAKKPEGYVEPERASFN